MTNSKMIGGTIVPKAPGSFGGTTFTEFNLSTTTGTPKSKIIGQSGTLEIVEVEVIVPAPPSTNGVGDWPMRFFGWTLAPDTGGNPNQLYMCPDNSVLYVRWYQIINRAGSARTVKLFFLTADGYFQQESLSLSAGAAIESAPGFMFDLGEGEIIAGSASGADVYCNVAGIESVQS